MTKMGETFKVYLNQIIFKILIQRGGGTGPLKPRQRSFFKELCQFQKAIA
ncbi:hypothetical protein SB48_HM08orf01365 [Heyndrickxia coagulans]|uniref:Uncharacterized protein n=1 Tax=Heyndrickxia coagulans TaxID=1398 RepID=A0AAN0T431_HEYCO|nr:hypothetical protein SB48_HM08orf01365 [Heyndrickxia coagulans]